MTKDFVFSVTEGCGWGGEPIPQLFVCIFIDHVNCIIVHSLLRMLNVHIQAECFTTKTFWLY